MDFFTGRRISTLVRSSDVICVSAVSTAVPLRRPFVNRCARGTPRRSLAVNGPRERETVGRVVAHRSGLLLRVVPLPSAGTRSRLNKVFTFSPSPSSLPPVVLHLPRGRLPLTYFTNGVASGGLLTKSDIVKKRVGYRRKQLGRRGVG